VLAGAAPPAISNETLRGAVVIAGDGMRWLTYRRAGMVIGVGI
jgi:hypothetical protein